MLPRFRTPAAAGRNWQGSNPFAGPATDALNRPGAPASHSRLPLNGKLLGALQAAGSPAAERRRPPGPGPDQQAPWPAGCCAVDWWWCRPWRRRGPLELPAGADGLATTALYPTSEGSRPTKPFGTPPARSPGASFQVLSERGGWRRRPRLGGAIVGDRRALQTHLRHRRPGGQCLSLRIGPAVSTSDALLTPQRLGYERVPTIEQEGSWSRTETETSLCVSVERAELAVRLEVLRRQLSLEKLASSTWPASARSIRSRPCV